MIAETEQETSEEKEVIKVVDETLAKRMIEILNTGITIQDMACSIDMKGLNILHLIKEVEDIILETVIMRMKDKTGTLVTEGEFTWELATLRSKSQKKKVLIGILAQQVAKLKARMEEIIEKQGSDNKITVKK